VASVTDPKISEFLSAGTRTGKLAYAGQDGRPLVAPIWFIVEDGDLVFNTGKDTAKGRALARDPRAALCVDLEEPPFGFVQVQGDAELSEDPGELVRTATAIAARYMGPGRAEEYGKRNGVPGELVVRLRPVKVIAAFDITA
jgi:PPOX class probable F420-dependent enzyme